MKISFVRASMVLLSVLFMMRGVSLAQDAQTEGTAPPIEQPLVREGDLAVSLAESLALGATENETEAQGLLNAAGIAPKNGWISDYPVTPDVIGELQASVADAADSGTLDMGKDEALLNLQDVLEAYGLAVRAGGADGARDASGPPADLETYYGTVGPPVVTYYAPPPAYAYLYTWVPYPFWWWNVWYPGYFVMVDFNIRFQFYERVRFYPRHRPHSHHFVVVKRRPMGRSHLDYRARPPLKDHRPGEGVSNYLRDRKTGKVRRIDPAKRSTRPPARESFGTRGFGAQRPHGGTSSSAFDRFGNARTDGAASDRGFRSRSNAGIIPGVKPYRTPQARPEKPAERGRQSLDRPSGEQRREQDVRREGFRDRRGGTFHGGGGRPERRERR